VIDRDRSRVYAAEDQWSAVLDRGGTVNFFGSQIHVSAQRRFADIASVQRYVDSVLGLAQVQEFNPAPVRVRARKGGTRAHYSDGVIAVPIQKLWSGRESVVLHELAHHLTWQTDTTHSAVFRSTMMTLVRASQSAESSLILMAAYEEALRG
jgi:putative metallohydrolase (TIGR04338 family)